MLVTVAGPVHAAEVSACAAAVARAERQRAIPARVLGTIAIVESGRIVRGTTVPWPWAVNIDGTSRYFATKPEAVDAVRALLQGGPHSIDVGCMQINLAAHPQAFSSLDDAFDPARNADYAARFLRSLLRESGQLARAITNYHSRTPSRAADYARRILAVWPGAADFGLGPTAPASPFPLTPRFAAEQVADRARLPDHGAESALPRSRLQIVSRHGPAWPGERH